MDTEKCPEVNDLGARCLRFEGHGGSHHFKETVFERCSSTEAGQRCVLHLNHGGAHRYEITNIVSSY